MGQVGPQGVWDTRRRFNKRSRTASCVESALRVIRDRRACKLDSGGVDMAVDRHSVDTKKLDRSMDTASTSTVLAKGGAVHCGKLQKNRQKLELHIYHDLSK